MMLGRVRTMTTVTRYRPEVSDYMTIVWALDANSKDVCYLF
jgi:hypothetical protein